MKASRALKTDALFARNENRSSFLRRHFFGIYDLGHISITIK